MPFTKKNIKIGKETMKSSQFKKKKKHTMKSLEN